MEYQPRLRSPSSRKEELTLGLLVSRIAASSTMQAWIRRRFEKRRGTTRAPSVLRLDVGDLLVAGMYAISSLSLFLFVYHRFASGRETLQLVIELVGSRYPFAKLRS